MQLQGVCRRNLILHSLLLAKSKAIPVDGAGAQQRSVLSIWCNQAGPTNSCPPSHCVCTSAFSPALSVGPPATGLISTDVQAYTALSDQTCPTSVANVADLGPLIVVVSKTESTCGPTYYQPCSWDQGPAQTTIPTCTGGPPTSVPTSSSNPTTSKPKDASSTSKQSPKPPSSTLPTSASTTGCNGAKFSGAAADPKEQTYGSVSWRDIKGQENSDNTVVKRDGIFAGAFAGGGIITAVALDLTFWSLAVPVTAAYLPVFFTFAGAVSAALALVVAMVGWGIYELVKWIIGFRNDDRDHWPLYDEGDKDENGKTHTDALWAIRLFSDEGCGNHPTYGGDPYHSGSMMAEYISNDASYSDGKPCQSFMIDQSHKVSSAAVWMGAKWINDGTHGLIMLFSHPLCSITTNFCYKSDEMPNGTLPNQPTFDFPDYMQIYNGSAQLWDHGDDYKIGQWACYKGRWASFATLWPGITNVCTPDGYTITKENTVPDPGKLQDANLVDYGSYMTTDIDKTWQKGTQLDVNLFPGSGRPGRGYNGPCNP